MATLQAIGADIRWSERDEVNFYTVREGGRITVIDAGLPGHHADLANMLAEQDATIDDVAAVLITHAHPDHVGFAQRLRRTGARVLVHAQDRDTVATGTRVDLPVRFRRNLWRPRVLRILSTWVRRRLRPWGNLTGGDVVPAVPDAEPVRDGDRLDVPGSPQVLHMPGHTPGSAAYVFGDHGAVFTGGSFVTVDIVTGQPGMGPAPTGLNVDDAAAVQSLQRLVDVEPSTILPGHGDPVRAQSTAAIETAIERGTDW